MNTQGQNFLQTFLLLAAITVLFFVVGWFIGGIEGALLALGGAAALNLGAWYRSGRMAIQQTNAQPVSEAQAPEIHQVVEELARRANIPKPEIYIIDSDVPNAFATGRNPADGKIAVTTGILNILDKDELAGVLAHELAHIDNYDILTGSIAGVLASAVSFLANTARYTMASANRSRSRGNPIGALLAIVLAPLAATIIRFAVTRSREIGADAEGAYLLGNPLPLADALLKLEQYSSHSHTTDPKLAKPSMAHMWITPPSLGSLQSLFRTHPTTEERVRRLRAMANEPEFANA